MTPLEKAQDGLDLIKAAILDLLEPVDKSMTNAEIAKLLSLESDRNGAQKNYLSWAILGILMNENLIIYEDRLYRRVA